MGYQLVYKDNPILRQKAEVVEKVDDKIRYLINRMYAVMKSKNGIGLAANQIGVLKRIVVLNTTAYENGVRFSIVNPEIVSHSEETVKGSEGCLSCPGDAVEIERWANLMVKGLDTDGKEFYVDLYGISARAMQQEIDHLNGILIVDKQ